MGINTQKSVSFFVNCFERDYRKVLSPGFIKAKALQFRYPFIRRVVTINNVKNRQDALTLAQAAIKRGEIDLYLEVEKELPAALTQCGLSIDKLHLIRHYIDFALVAVVAAQDGYLLYCAPEVDLLQPFDWISPALHKLNGNPDFLVANPTWASDLPGAARESLHRDGIHFVGYGFSDQCFLIDAARLAKPVYGFVHPAGVRYPMSDLGDIFEKRIDAYMRCTGLLRLTDPRAFYIHEGPEGMSYPKKPFILSIKNRLRSSLKRHLKMFGGNVNQ